MSAPGLERIRAEQPLLADYLVEPMLGVTLTPTKAEAGKKANVIPSEAEALIDCRVPPGFGKDEARERLEALIGDGDYEIEFSEAVVGNSSPMDSPLADAIRVWLGEADPGAEIAPIVMPGFSDSNPFRTAFPDAVVYGFCPHREVGPARGGPADPRRRRARPGRRRRALGPLLLRAAPEDAGVSDRPSHERRPGAERRRRPTSCGSAGWRFATAC